jgi:type IV pilus secretin PilQ/predicted competence protein
MKTSFAQHRFFSNPSANRSFHLATLIVGLSALGLYAQEAPVAPTTPAPAATDTPAAPAPAATESSTTTATSTSTTTSTPDATATTTSTTTNTATTVTAPAGAVGADTPSAFATPPAETAAAPAVPAKPKKQVLNFENADLRVVLQAMAKQAGISLILPDDVRGNVTARLIDVPIQKAMKTIVESKGYSLVELDGVYHVKSKESVNQEPLRNEIYQFANASAKEAKPTADKLLSKASGANVQIDERSNTLVITDVPSSLAKILPILKTLDSATPQVLIETKLMEMTRNPQEAIGVNWSSLASYQVTLASPTAAVSGSGTANTSSGRLITGITRSGNPGALGSSDAGRRGGILTLAGAATGAYPFAAVLDAPAFSMTFSFLLQDSDTELLGSPKVITADNQQAVIRIATQEPIPNFTFNQQTASFVISGFEFKDIGNVLTVTPHVNKENYVTLDVTPEVSTALTGANGRGFALGTGGSVTIPLISVRTLTSRVKVKSGHTLALGGLLESAQTRGYSKVPFLGDIPALGELFRSHSYTKTKRNLLIFITPTVISQDGNSGLEDQYAQLREPNEDDRFAYKRSFLGNAKPRDQFGPSWEERSSKLSDQAASAYSKAMEPTASEGELLPPTTVPILTPSVNTDTATTTTTVTTETTTTTDRPTGEPTTGLDLDLDQLAPRLAPALRE